MVMGIWDMDMPPEANIYSVLIKKEKKKKTI